MPTPEELELERKKKALEAQILGGYADMEIKEDKYGVPTLSSILGEYYYSPIAPDPMLRGLIPNETERQTVIGQLADLKAQQEVDAMIESGLDPNSINYKVIYDRHMADIREQYVQPTTSAAYGDWTKKTAPAEMLGIDIKAAAPYTSLTGIEPSITGPVSPFRPQQEELNPRKFNTQAMIAAFSQEFPDVPMEAISSQVDGIEAAYYAALMKYDTPEEAMNAVWEEIGKLDTVAALTVKRTPGMDRYKPNQGAFGLQVTERGEIPDYSPIQMAYVKGKIEKPYDRWWGENRKKIGEEQVDLVTFTYMTDGNAYPITVPKEVFDYLQATNPTTTATLISPQVDKVIRDGIVATDAGKGSADSLKFGGTGGMGGALTTIRAINEFGDPKAWYLDPRVQADIKANPDKYTTEGFFTDMDYMGRQAETSKAYAFRMGMVPLNLLATGVQEMVLEPFVEPVVAGITALGFEAAAKTGYIPEADYFTEAVLPEFLGGDPSVLDTARRKSRIAQTPDYASSPYLASIALNKGLTGEFMDVSNALGLEGWQKYTVVGGGLAGDILSPDFGILIAGSKALKSGGSLLKSQKILNQSTNATEIAKVMGGSGLNAFAKDTNFISSFPYGVEKTAEGTTKLKTVGSKLGAATEHYGDVRTIVGAKTAKELESMRIAEASETLEDYGDALREAGIDKSKVSDDIIERMNYEGEDFKTARAKVGDDLAKNIPESRTGHKATQEYLEQGKREGFIAAEEAAIRGAKIDKPLLESIEAGKGKRLSQMKADEITDVQKLVDAHYGRSAVFEAAPKLGSLEDVVAMTRKTFAHASRQAEIIAQSNKSPLAKKLSEIYFGATEPKSVVTRTADKAKQAVGREPSVPTTTQPRKIKADRVGRDAERARITQTELGEYGGVAKPQEVENYFILEGNDADQLQMYMYNQKVQQKLTAAELTQMQRDIQNGKLYFSDYNKLREITIDDAALTLQRGVVTTQDISKLPPKMQKAFLDAPGVRSTGAIAEYVSEKWEALAEKVRKSTVPEKATPDAATFEQRRLYDAVKQEASTMDIKLRNTVNDLRASGKEAEDLRELYGLDRNKIPTSHEALGAAIVGPRTKTFEYTIPDGAGGREVVDYEDYLDWVALQREDIIKARAEQQVLLRELPEQKQALIKQEMAERAEAAKTLAKTNEELEKEFAAARKAEAATRDAKLKQVRATTKESKAEAQAAYLKALEEENKVKAKAIDDAKTNKQKAIDEYTKEFDEKLKELDTQSQKRIDDQEIATAEKIEKAQADAKAKYDETRDFYIRREKEIAEQAKADLEAEKEIFEARKEAIDNADDVDLLDDADVSGASEQFKAFRQSYKQAQKDVAEVFDDAVRQAETDYTEMMDLIQEISIEEMLIRMEDMPLSERVAELERMFENIKETDMARRAGLKEADFNARSFRAQLGWANRREKEILRQALGGKADSWKAAIRQKRKEEIIAARAEMKESQQAVKDAFKEQRAGLREDLAKFKANTQQKKRVAVEQARNQLKNARKDRTQELKDLRQQGKDDLQQIRIRENENIKLARQKANDDFAAFKAEEQAALKAEKKSYEAQRDWATDQISKSYDDAVDSLKADKQVDRAAAKELYVDESDALRRKYKKEREALEEAATKDIPSPKLEESVGKITATQALQLQRVSDTAGWALGRLFYHVKESTSVTDRVVGLNQLAQRNTFLSKYGKENLDDLLADFTVKVYENPARYWDHFSELVTDYVKLLGDEKALAPGVTSDMIEKKFLTMQDTLKNEATLGMYYWAEGDRIVNKHLLRAVQEDVVVASTEEVIATMKQRDSGTALTLETIAENRGVSPELAFEEDLKAWILESFNRPETNTLKSLQRTLGDMAPTWENQGAGTLGGRYNIALTQAKTWQEFDEALFEMKVQQEEMGVYGYVEREVSQAVRYQRHVQEVGDQIIRNNNLWNKLDTDADKAADFLNELFKNEKAGKTYLGEAVYNDLQNALSQGRIQPLSRQLDQLMKDLSLGAKAWQASKNFMNGLMSVFYKGVLSFAPQFHMNNITTASTITYTTVGKFVGPKGVAEGIKVVQASGPTQARFYEIAVTSPDGRVYTYGDINRAIYSGGVKSEFQMITSAINDNSLIKFIEDNNTRTTGLSQGAINWMKDWAKVFTAEGKLGKAKAAGEAVMNIPGRPLGAFGDKASELMISEDVIFRAAVMIDAIKEGKTIDEATALGRRSMYDYNNMNPTEKAFAATTFVFYSFFRQNMTNFLTGLMDPTKAKKIAHILRFDNGVERAMVYLNEDKQFDPKVYMPDYTLPKTVLNVQNGQSKNYYMTTPAIPALDAMMTVAGIFASPVDEVQEITRRMVSPVVRGGLDLANPFEAKGSVPNEWVQIIQLFQENDDPFAVAQQIQVLTGGIVTPVQVTDELGVEIGGKNWIFPMDPKQAEAFNSYMNALNFAGLTRVPIELARIMGGTGAYAPYSYGERLVMKPMGLTPASKQELYNLYARRAAILEQISALKSQQSKTEDAKIENYQKEQK